MKRQHFFAALMLVTGPAFADDVDQSQRDFQPATYCAFEIPRLPGLPPGEISIDLKGINNRNQIVGWTTPAGTPPLHSFIWDRKRGIRDLGSLPEHPSMVAVGINNAGTIVGDALDFATGERVPFIWTRKRGVRELDASLGGFDSGATGINNAGQIVGASETATGAFHAFLREVNGDVLDLGTFPDGRGGSGATAVNDRGQVVGIRGDGQISEAFLWDERRGIRRLIEDPPPFTLPWPLGINNRGEVAGEIIAATTRGFRWTRRDGLQDLGSLNGLETDFTSARAINNWGAIVGASSSSAGGVAHAFIWTRQTGMLDLNNLVDPSSDLPSQLVLGTGQAINDRGSIAVLGFVPGEESQRAFMLVPRRHSDGACP